MFEKTPWADYKPRNEIGPVKLAFRKLCQLLARFIFFYSARITLFRLMGMHIGKNVYIGYDCFFDSDYAELISIEDNAVISFRVSIAAHDGSTRIASKVLIKKSAFIGAGAIILPGVTIGEKAIVGAGAVVAKDVAGHTTVIGNPAKEFVKPV